MSRLRLQLHFLHVLKDPKPQARRVLLASADEELIKPIVEYELNTLNGNHKLTKEENSKFEKYENRLRELIDLKICLKSKRKLLVQKGRFIVLLLASVLSGVVGSLISNNNN